MLANLAYVSYPTWSVGPTVVSTLTFLLICLLLLSRSSTRGLIGYCASVGALSGLIYNTLIMAAYIKSPSIAYGIASPVSYVFYGIYISFAFIPGLNAFSRTLKPNGSNTSKYIIYLGYIWVFITIVIGFALTIYIAIIKNDLGYLSPERWNAFVNSVANLISFMHYSGWAFVATHLVLITANIGHIFPGKPRNSLLAYFALNMLAVLVNTIIINLKPTSTGINLEPTLSSLERFLSTIYAVTLVFCDISVAIALIIATYYGNLWKYNSEKLSTGVDKTTDA